MAQTAQQSDFVSERAAAQPARDIVSNSSDSETSKTWSSIASKIWSSDSSKSDAANPNGKPMDFSVPKALSDSLGLSTQLAATQFQGIQPLDAQAQLENRGLLPKTRISPTGAEGQRNGVVKLPDIEMARAGQRERTGQGERTGSREQPGQRERTGSREQTGQRERTGQREQPVQRERTGRGDRTGQSDRAPEAGRRVVEPEGGLGKVYELKLQNNTGRHKVDASVIIPQGYDPQKPTRMLVYNHGFRTDAHAALSYSDLREQMRSADPQTVLVVPEWQASPGSNSSARGRSDQPNFYRNMFNEIMRKTPELAGKDVDSLASIGIISHSAGYNPSIAQLYKNGLQDKITSVTVLDSMYNPTAYDGWIKSNLRELASGNKHFQLIYTGHLANQSTGLQGRVEQQLARAGLGNQSIYKDHARGTGLVSPDAIAQHGFVFKRSEFTNRGDGAHGAMTHVYLRQLLKSERRAP